MQKKSIPNSEVARPPDLGARIAELEEREAEHLRSEQIRSALYHIADAASAVEDMRAFYAEMHRIVGELMHVDTFSIVLYDQPSQTVSFPYIVEEVGQEEAPPKSLREALGRTLTAYVLRTGEPLLAPPETVDELERSGEVEPIGPPSVDWLGVPLRSEGETVGALVVQTHTEDTRYTDADHDLLVFIAHHIAAALTRARLLDETRQRAAELVVLNSVGEGLARQLDFQGVIDLVGEKVREVFRAQATYIALYDRKANLIRFPYFVNGETRHD
nr:GAF domain-containing protein [Chloroflexia bacterium]